MANFKRKRSRKQTVGCACCHILKNNSASRTKPKDRVLTYPSRFTHIDGKWYRDRTQ